MTEETFCDSLSLLYVRQREWEPFESGMTAPRSTKDVEIPRLGHVTSLKQLPWLLVTLQAWMVRLHC